MLVFLETNNTQRSFYAKYLWTQIQKLQLDDKGITKAEMPYTQFLSHYFSLHLMSPVPAAMEFLLIYSSLCKDTWIPSFLLKTQLFCGTPPMKHMAKCELKNNNNKKNVVTKKKKIIKGMPVIQWEV